MHPEPTDPMFALAFDHHQAGRISEAEGLYRRIIASDPGHPGALYLLAGIAYQCEKYHEARELVDRAIQNGADDNPGARLLLGLSAHRLGESALAIDIIHQTLELEPEFAEAHASLGDVLLERGEFEQAVASYEEALALKPGLFATRLNLASARINLSTLLARQGRLEAALDGLRKVLALHPDNSDAHCNIGALLLTQGRAEEAAVSLQKALALNPGHSDAHSNLGALLMREGKLEEAAASLEKAVALNPNNSDAHCNIGALLLNQGRPEEAAVSLGKALALNPDNSDAYCNIGAMLLDQGRFDEVIAVGRRALSIRPDSARAHEVMGRAYHHKGDLEEAAKCYRGAVELGTTNASIPHFLAAVTGENVGPVPKAAVVSLFERYAPRFDAHLIGELGYTTPMLMREAIGRLTHDRRFQQALDLGCGTGLVGASFGDIVGEIIGVDLSARMLEQAGRRAIYANLHLDEIVDWLEHAAANRRIFDIVLSADVFNYVGNLEPVFKGVRAVLAGGGLLVFSVEYLAQGSYQLLPTGRFGHGVAYIRELASTHGLQIELVEPIDLRRDLGEMIPGMIFVLQRPEPS